VVEKASTEEIRLILKMMSKGYKVPKIINDVVFETAKREIEDKEKTILYKRDPNIHSRRIQGAYVKVIKENTIEIHPLACGGFGADFDGDSTFSKIVLLILEDGCYKPLRIHISEFDKYFECRLESENRNENSGVVVKNFKVTDDVYCYSIGECGDIAYKKITHWSIHENLKMFSINRKKRNCLIGDIKELWVSDNHSIVAIDNDSGIIGRINPEELKNNSERYFLIKNVKRLIKDVNYRNFILREEALNSDVSDIKLGYFIGALLGDGDISNDKLVLHTSFKPLGHAWSDIFDRLLESTLNDCARREVSNNYSSPTNLRDRDDNPYERAMLWGYRGGNNIATNFRCFGQICEDKHLPDWTVNSSDDFVTGLFAGYIDTDGMVRLKELSVESKSKQLLDDFRFVLYYRLGIETSFSEDFKNYNLGTGGRKIPISNPEDYRKYWVLHLPIRKEYTEFLTKVYELINNPEKKAKLSQYLEACQSKPSTKRVLWVPREILKHPDFVKGKTDGVTSDIRYVIKRSSFTQKDMKIPDHIIEESNISEAFKTLLYKQNKGEIEIIPATCLDIEYDPEMTTGYDFTVEDYKTFTTDTGIFLYDTMAIYAPISEQAQQQIKDKMITLNNTTKIGASNFKFQNEIYISIFTLTIDVGKNTPKKVKTMEEVKKLKPDQLVEMNFKGKTIKSTVGRFIFNEILPAWHPFVDEPVNKKKLDNICKEIMLKNQFDYAETIDKVMDIGFLYATLYPKSIDLEMLEIPSKLMNMKNRLLETKDISEQSAIIDDIEVALLEHLKKTKSDLYYIVASGGAKGIGQLRQMMVCKGLIQDPNGNVLPPITKSINEGYTPKEYFDAAAGSRKGTADRAINTGNGGYAYRKMIYVVGNVTADISNADCGSKRTMNIKLTKDLFDRMTGRYVLNDKNDITPINKSMIGKIVRLRSPIFCKTDSICRICYGELIHQVNTKNVGMIAAQEVASLSEKIMKSFHTGGAVIMQKFDFIKEFMDNLDDLMEPKLRKKIEQSGNDLINKSDLATIRIDKHIYESSQEVKIIDNEIPLQVGHFVLELDGLEVPIAIEQEMTLFIPNEIEQNDRYIVLMYGKNDKILSIKPKQENFSQLARYLDALVGGKYPWGNVQTLYKKFFKALSPVGDWDSTHLEVIISNVLRSKKDPQKPARLVEPFDPEMYSIKTLPNIISYPLGIAFENFNKGIQYGMITERAPESSIEKVISGEPLTKERK